MTGPRDGLGRYLHNDDVTAWLSGITRRLVAPGAELPLFGSAEWHQAAAPVRLASALRAAEAWRRDGLYAAQDTADELSAARWVQGSQDAAEWAQAAGRVSRIACGPSHEELLGRRREVVRPAGLRSAA